MFNKKQLSIIKYLIERMVLCDREARFGLNSDEAATEYQNELEAIARTIDPPTAEDYVQQLIKFKNQFSDNIDEMLRLDPDQLDEQIDSYDIMLVIKNGCIFLPMMAENYQRIDELLAFNIDETIG